MKCVVCIPEIGEITLCRSQRNRRICLSVNRRGQVRVSYPAGVSRARAEEFARSRTEWIVRTRERMQQRNRQPEIQIRPGMQTRCHTLRFAGTGAGRTSIRITDTEAVVYCPEGCTGTQLRTAALKALTEAWRAEAHGILPQRLRTLAASHGFRFGTVRIKAMRSKWGSCTARGDINLSLYLMMLPDELIDFVLLHELCHTVHHNHSAAFHSLLDKLLGGREKELNSSLRQFHPPAGS